MANVTYLLGAGASCHCLPTYKNFGERFLLFQNFFTNILRTVNRNDEIDLKNILQLCQKISGEFFYHNTPDTIAKKYFHLKESGQENLRDLKSILILFFIYEQSMGLEMIQNGNLKNHDKSPIDKRYDSFIASILKPIFSEIKIASNFNILTWNYDLQFEMCFQNYCRKKFIDVQLDLQSMPSIKTAAQEFNYDANKFSITHLNGIAFSQMNNGTTYGSIHNSDQLLAKSILEHYRSLLNQSDTFDNMALLNFAWERDESYPGSKDILRKTIETSLTVASETEVLVIIGYSFPIFNREVDLMLFKAMTKIKKIYVQSPDAGLISEIIAEIFSSVNKRISQKIIKTINSLDYFHIPSEWNREVPDPFTISVA